MDEGRFTIPSRVYLSAAQRDELERLLRHQERELDELLTELLGAYLESNPAPQAPEAPAAPPDDELRRRRAELRRLRPRLNDPHNPPPPWLTQMAAELEAEIARLEAQGRG
jgi:hypothetical protein